MKKNLFLLSALFMLITFTSTVLAQEDKDIDGFDGIMIGVKKPMYAKVLVKNNSEFVKDLELLPDVQYKKMNLAANWGTVAETTVFSPESNQAVVNFLFAIRRSDLKELIEFQEKMDEDDEGNLVEAGLFDLEIETSRAKYVTALARFVLNGKEIVRNVNFSLAKENESDFGTDIPIFTATIDDEALGIPLLKFKAESKLPFSCYLNNKKLGLSLAVNTDDEKDISLLAANMPEDGVYKFKVQPIIGGYFVPELELPFLINNGEISLVDNPFSLDNVSNGGNGKGNSMVTLRNERNAPITLLIPEEYVGKGSLSSKKDDNYAVGTSGKKMNWKAIQIAPRSSTKVWLSKTFFNGLVICKNQTDVKMFHVENKSSQTNKIGW